MATLAVPLIAAVTPLLIEEVVKLVDKALGPKTGAVKLPTSTAIVQTLGAGAVQTGQAPSPAPTLDQTTPLVQAAVDRLNAKGELKGAATVIGTPAAAAGLTQADAVALARSAMQVLTLTLPKIA